MTTEMLAATAQTDSLPCVVLFDIDGTLITGPHRRRSAGVRAMDVASRAATGKPSVFSGADYAGRTDPQIAGMLLKDAGVPVPSGSEVNILLAHYISALEKEISDYPFRVIGRPKEAVTGLRAQGAIVGLGTGNIRAGAVLKLTSAGIADLFDFEKGGFGEDGETRAELLDRGATMLNPERDLPVVIIGDTPHDVAGAKGMGARCIGIPFGSNNRADLEKAGADRVIEKLDRSLPSIVRDLIRE